MKITNKTKYRTDDLRKFIYWVAKQEMYDASYTKRLVVEAVPARRWHTGCAPLGGRHITIRIPKPDIMDKTKLASLIAHEMLHNNQKRSDFKPYTTERQMRGSSRYGYHNNEMHWSGAKELELRVIEPKVKQVKGPHDRALAGQAKAAKKVADYEKKIKREQKLLKKWQKKLKYYDKRVDVTKDMPAPAPRKPVEKKPVKKVPAVYRNDDGKVVVALSDKTYGELQCTEVDTFDAESPKEYGSEQEYNERKDFCDAMENAKVIGKKIGHRRYILTMGEDGAEYFAHKIWIGGYFEMESPAAVRTLEDRQYKVGALIAKKAASEGRVYAPERGKRI